VSDENINIPTIKGRIGERLQRAKRRDRSELPFGESGGEVVLRTPQERGVVGLALLVLEQLAEHGGTRASQRTLESVLRKVLSTLGAKEIMDLEIETYEMLLWIGSSIDPDWKTDTPIDASDIDPHSGHAELVQFAIATGQDLELDYYSRNRGELTQRRITPISIEAETYIHAYCHLRRDERVFRISRVAELRPVGGWSKVKKAPKKVEEPDDSGQMDLL
jgi:predicted DNA-binding transcriptional regulator YafY